MSTRSFGLGHAIRVTLMIGWSDFLLKYRGSVLGYFWSLIAPLAKFLVIFAVFHPLVGPDIVQYPLYLFLGIIFWEFFSNVTQGCMNMLHDKSAIIQKIQFPRIILILAVGCTNVIIFGTHLLIALLFAAVTSVPISWAIVYLPILLLQSLGVFLGIGMLLSAFSLKYRDIPHLWDILLQIFFWLTPITYALPKSDTLSADAMALLSGKVSWSAFTLIVRFQPVSVLLSDLRRILLDTSSRGMPSPLHLGAVVIFSIGLFVIGARVFSRRSGYFLEEY